MIFLLLIKTKCVPFVTTKWTDSAILPVKLATKVYIPSVLRSGRLINKIHKPQWHAQCVGLSLLTLQRWFSEICKNGSLDFQHTRAQVVRDAASRISKDLFINV